MIGDLKRENKGLIDKDNNNQEMSKIFREQNDLLKHDLQQLKDEKNGLQSTINDLNLKYDESLRDLMGLRAEIKHLDHEKIELKTQLDKKINLIWTKEKELRETKQDLEEKTSELLTFQQIPSLSGTLERESFHRPPISSHFDNELPTYNPYIIPRFSSFVPPLHINDYPPIPHSYYPYQPTFQTNITIPPFTSHSSKYSSNWKNIIFNYN